MNPPWLLCKEKKGVPVIVLISKAYSIFAVALNSYYTSFFIGEQKRKQQDIFIQRAYVNYLKLQ